MKRRFAETMLAAALYGFSAGAVHSLRMAGWSALKFPLLILSTILLSSLAWQCVSRFLAPALRFPEVASIALRTFHRTALFLASLCPVTFFLARTITPPDAGGLGEYPLFLGLNVGFIALSGTAALGLETRRLARGLGLGPRRAVSVLGAWLAICLFAGGQCAWIMRPFFGPATIRDPPFMEGSAPDFRGARSFYEAVYHLVCPPPLPPDWPRRGRPHCDTGHRSPPPLREPPSGPGRRAAVAPAVPVRASESVSRNPPRAAPGRGASSARSEEDSTLRSRSK
ncbi:MAG: hypothetical protein MUE73_16150, partial [Planctomycetes bacterium]|nr:hypothetical protein [Planctomycetota bacterium]